MSNPTNPPVQRLLNKKPSTGKGLESATLKQIHTVCIDCGNKYGIKKKTVMGVWQDTCDICGQVKGCAAAGYDFGIYNNPEEKQRDEIMEAI